MNSALFTALRGLYISSKSRELLAPEMEMVYRSLFLRNLHDTGIDDEFYPVGNAANHSLLYFVSRCLCELPISRVLEFGAGQTSLLLDRLSARLLPRDVEIFTIENDPNWASHIGKKVRHQVIHTPLTEKVVDGRKISFYESEEVNSKKKIELAIVDGPAAYTHTTRWNRLGAASYLQGRLASDFVVIFDDTERCGESRSAELFGHYLKSQNIVFFTSTIRAVKQQQVFCSEKFRAAAYF
jgi:hypothetical protein